MYEERTYRNLVRIDDLVKFEVIVKETDLLVRAEKDLSREARASILKYRHHLKRILRCTLSSKKALFLLRGPLWSGGCSGNDPNLSVSQCRPHGGCARSHG